MGDLKLSNIEIEKLANINKKLLKNYSKETLSSREYIGSERYEMTSSCKGCSGTCEKTCQGNCDGACFVQ